MLYFIKGRAGSGKTAFLRQEIINTVNSGQSKPLLIIPEQFSFETERAMLKLCGAKNLKKIDVFSFSRLAFSVLKNTPFFTKKLPDDGVRAAIMSETLNQLEGRLTIFNSCKGNSAALEPLIDFCKELKYCCIDSDELLEKTDLLEESYLKEKLKEIQLINQAYDALLTQSYFDDTDAVQLLSSFCAQNDYFRGKTVFFDGFRAFSKQELLCIDVILSQADNVYITLCADEKNQKYSPFYYIRDLEIKLRTISAKHKATVKEVFCNQKENTFSSDIFQLEKGLFSQKRLETVKSDESIKIIECKNSDEECKYVAAEIKKLIRKFGYRCREIGVIERTNGTYKNRIVENLKKLDIPVFDDSRRSLSFETLFVYINSVLSCITNGFTTENIFNYLKTGFSDLSLGEISRLEKYALVWGVTGKTWLKDFTMHPDGFGNDFNDAALKTLDELNKSRKSAILPLLKLKKECENCDGKEIAREIYNFLVDRNIPEKLFELYDTLNKDGFPVEAQRQKVSWDVLMDLLDCMATLCEGKYYSFSRWFELFRILVESRDIGEIPQGLDEVRVGSADRIRIEQLKVVFLVGVNKNEFPLVSVKGGILTDADRVSLTDIGLEIRPPFEDSVDEERFIAYCAVTAASEKLYLTFKTQDDEGAKAFKSEIIDCALKNINDIQYVTTNQCDPLYFVESEENAFTLLSSTFSENTPLKSTLMKYFSDKNDYVGKIHSLERVFSNNPVKFSDENVSEKLFGENLYLSASRVEAFYNCPFAYFMRFGLKAEPLRVAELDPAQSGTIVHLVMETVLREYPKATFVNASDDELRQTVKGVLTKYLEEKMGGMEEKSKRFMFLFERLLDISMAIIERLKTEFKVGFFEPKDFELKIGGDVIPAYTLPLEKGGVTVTGSVDRVDLMEKDGIKYIRVVDYKTGKKEFKLCELFDGLNMQMVLYLMALEKNGVEYYGKTVPAGVLYLPSRIGISNYLERRSPSAENVAAQRRISGKLSGMVLDSPVVFNGMGVDKFPDYFPVGYKKDGSSKGDFYSLADFNSLSHIIDKKITDMGNALHKGEISAIPCGNDGEGKMCKYCSYKPICAREYGDEIYELTSLTHAKALERLEVEDNEQRMDD